MAFIEIDCLPASQDVASGGFAAMYTVTIPTFSPGSVITNIGVKYWTDAGAPPHIDPGYYSQVPALVQAFLAYDTYMSMTTGNKAGLYGRGDDQPPTGNTIYITGNADALTGAHVRIRIDYTGSIASGGPATVAFRGPFPGLF